MKKQTKQQRIDELEAAANLHVEEHTKMKATILKLTAIFFPTQYNPFVGKEYDLVSEAKSLKRELAAAKSFNADFQQHVEFSNTQIYAENERLWHILRVLAGDPQIGRPSTFAEQMGMGDKNNPFKYGGNDQNLNPNKRV